MRGAERERESNGCTIDFTAPPTRERDALSPRAAEFALPDPPPDPRRGRVERSLRAAKPSRLKPAPARLRAPPARTLEVKAMPGAATVSVEAVAQAWRDYKAGGSIAARDLLIIYYMSGHVRRIAHRLGAQLPKQIDPDDLVQHVYRGLVRLIDRFDPERDVQFETFSSRRLVGAMRDYLRDLDTSGRQARQRAKRLREIEGRFWAENGRPPDAGELQSLLELPDDIEFRKFIDDARAPLTVSFTSGGSGSDSSGGGATASAGGGWDDADGFAGFSDRRLPPPLMRLEREDLRKWLTEGLARRDRLIVVLYYYEQMTMKEIGQTLGCSESRVSQRLDSILECLRARLTRVGAAALE